jgi:predicted nucleotidyltransferase
LQIIESQRESLIHAEMNLFEQLEYYARQPLEHLQEEEYVDMNLINHIQQINKQIREDNKYLKWQLTTTIPPPISSSTLPTIPSAMEEQKFSFNFDINKISSNKSIDLQQGRGLKRLVQLFANISLIKQTKKDIVFYLKVS